MKLGNFRRDPLDGEWLEIWPVWVTRAQLEIRRASDQKMVGVVWQKPGNRCESGHIWCNAGSIRCTKGGHQVAWSGWGSGWQLEMDLTMKSTAKLGADRRGPAVNVYVSN